MLPFPLNPCHDPRWLASRRAASLATLALNAGLVIALVLIRTAPVPPSSPEPLALEFKVQVAPEPPAPVLKSAVIPDPLQTTPEPPPPVEPRPRPEPPKPEKSVAPARKMPAKAVIQPNPPVLPAPEPFSAAAAVREPAPPRTAETAAPSEMARILATLIALVEQHRDYPKAAQRAGYEGVVVMAVSMDRSGVITGWSLNQASAYPMLDKAAEKTFAKLVGQRIEGAGLSDGLRVVVPVRYELRGRS